ncbi:Acylphosphatase [Caballeronia sp. SBC1]|uniref:acylphosphatase n=1 Tax=Caballeronia sp. SBC1 TaxID=2705548 RepID=UPI001407CBB5|nr:acylphosphatase [Caballeronia sp. SBC1]QIN62637.1 Acylphosphatase [Caballeronia sp. SBC1]
MKDEQTDGVLETWLVRVRGIVQGVGYREACVRRAHSLGVTGWVRNRMDGSVEVMVKGSPKRLSDMCAWLGEGMSDALRHPSTCFSWRNWSGVIPENLQLNIE